jgi:hypothetical protein
MANSSLNKHERLEFVDQYLKSKGFWFADFGNYCYGKRSETLGISIEIKGYLICVSLIKFPECDKSSSVGIFGGNTKELQELLDILIFAVKVQG